MSLSYAGWLLVTVLAVWPWRRRRVRMGATIVRVLLAIAVCAWIYSVTNVGPAARRAIETDDRVEVIWAPDTLPAYSSGVYTMSREAANDMDRIFKPLLLALILLVVPSVLDVRKAWQEPS